MQLNILWLVVPLLGINTLAFPYQDSGVRYGGLVERGQQKSSSILDTIATATSSYAAPPTPYIIMVSQNATVEQIRDIRTVLFKCANVDSVSENNSGRTGLVAFWTAEITLAEVETLRATPGVSPKYHFSMPKLTKHRYLA